MKLKIILFVAAVVIFGASVIAIVIQPRHTPTKSTPTEDPLPAAISNYSKTFKLNTNPPIWPTPSNGRNTTN